MSPQNCLRFLLCQSSQQRNPNPGLIIAETLLSAAFAIAGAVPATAQITSDGTLPVPTRVTPTSAIDFNITDGTQVGGNLFHSFSQFSVPTSGSAVFNTTQYSGIQNIFSRVTGGSLSSIDGLIRATGTANLFLLNPAGILFGSNASLRLGGSFLASTGASIRFADGAEFSTNSQTPLLSVSVPIGVQFGSAPGSIRVAGSVLENTGRTIGLLGGDVTIEGGTNGVLGIPNLSAQTGRIELGGVGANSFVALGLIDRGFALAYDQVSEFRPIQMIRNSLIDANNGGDVQVRGSQIRLTDGSEIFSVNFTTAPGGNLIITASDSVEILGTGIYNLPTGATEIQTGLFNQTVRTGTAGTLSISARRLILRDGGIISASTFGAGQAGNLIINTLDAVEVTGFSPTDPALFSSIRSNSIGSGQAGNLVINTNYLSVKDGADISTTAFRNGQGGNLTVNASSVELIGGSASQTNGLFAQAGSSVPTANNPNARGNGGSLTLNTGTLLVQDGSRISTGTFTAGNAGNLVINATESVEVVGRSTVDGTPSTISAASSSPGAAGNLVVTADRFVVRNGATIAVSATNTGVAGDLQITSPFILLDNQGVLTAETRAGQGNISISSSDLRLRRNSLISTNATGTATGGNITIATRTLAAFENSDITANAQESFGGRVSIQAEAIFGTAFRLQLTPESDITATSALGPQFSGLVTIQTPGIDPSQGLVQLQTDVVDVSRLVAQTCLPESQQARGEFFVTGRGGLPPSPTDATGDEQVLVDLGKPLGDRSQPGELPTLPPNSPPTRQSSRTSPLLQAQGWIVNSAGKVVLLAQVPTPTEPTRGLLLPPCNTFTSR